MHLVHSHTEVDSEAWNNFMISYSDTPYPQSTYYGQYVVACYNSKPVYVSINLDDAWLKCLVLINENENSVKWSCGPVISGKYHNVPQLINLFFEWVLSLKLRIKKANFTMNNSLHSLSMANQFMTAVHSNGLRMTLSSLIKKDLTSDIWLDAFYFSGGKKRKINNIIERVKREGVSIVSYSGDAVSSVEGFYREHYCKAILQGYERNLIQNQSAQNAVDVIINQDRMGISRSFFALNDEDVLCCLNLVKIGNECYLRKLAFNRQSGYKDPGSSYYAMMTAAEWGRSLGLHTLNLSIARLSEDDKTCNIRRYKNRFGKMIVPLYELTAVE